MAEVFFKRLDSVFGVIEADEVGLIVDISAHFTFTVPNYFFQPAYKQGFWDGKIRLVKGKKLYAGLVNKLREYCEANNIKFSTDISDDVKISIVEVEEIIDSFDPYRFDDDLNRIPLEAHSEQVEAVQIALEEKGCILVNPTASGKSFIIATLTRIFEEMGLKVLIYLSLTTLATQLPDNFKEYYQHIWNPEIDRVWGGQETGKGQIVIGLWQSLQHKKPEYFEQFDAIICDEVHEASSTVAKKIFERCINAEYRIGLTGTLRDTQIDTLVLEGLFGTIHQLATTAQLIKEGKIAGLQIHQVMFKHDFRDYGVALKKLKEDSPRASPWQHEVSYISTNSVRINFLVNLAMSQKGNTLVVFNSIKHGKEIYRRLKEKHEHTYLIYGGVHGDDRDKIKLLADTLKTGVKIVASYKTFSTGANVKNIHTVILGESTKAKIRLAQTIGRGLRHKADKSKLLVIDVADNLPITKTHALDRIERYLIEEFPFRVIKI